MSVTKTVIDQVGRKVEIPDSPGRIVSLVPSQTELLAYLGLENELVGITKFCVRPDKVFRTKTRIGGTKNIHFDRIEVLDPDLIIGNKEENDKIQIEKLAEKYPVWLSDVRDLEDAYQMILQIGVITGKSEKAELLVKEIKDSFKSVDASFKGTVAYVIWNEPIMVVGEDTFINALLVKNGFVNVFKNETLRYPETNIEELQNLKPDFLLLSSEPFPFKEKHIKYFEENLPESKVMLVDGELFSWYGSRLLKSAEYFNRIFKK